jgi:hypothetical protein
LKAIMRFQTRRNDLDETDREQTDVPFRADRLRKLVKHKPVGKPEE